MNTLSTEKLDDFELISSLTSNKDYSLCFSYSGPDHKSNYPVLINLSSTPTNEIIKGNLEDSLKKWNIKFEVRKNYIELLKPDNNIPTIPSEIVNSSERYNKENFTHEYKETYLIEYLFLAINHCCNFLVPSWYGFVFLEMTRIIITYFELKNQGNPFRYQYIFEQLISEKYPNLKSSKQGVLKDLVALEKIGLVKKIEPAVYQSVKRGLTESEKLTISFLKEYYSKFTNINK